MRKFSTFSAIPGNTSLCLDFSKTACTTPTNVANLVVGNLSANAYVHRIPRRLINLHLNENDCQVDLDLLCSQKQPNLTNSIKLLNFKIIIVQ